MAEQGRLMWAGSELPRPPQLTIQAREAFRGATPIEGSAFMGGDASVHEEQDGGGWPKILGPFSSSQLGLWASPLLIGGVGHRSLHFVSMSKLSDSPCEPEASRAPAECLRAGQAQARTGLALSAPALPQALPDQHYPHF